VNFVIFVAVAVGRLSLVVSPFCEAG
jgi:hypothetical protein